MLCEKIERSDCMEATIIFYLKEDRKTIGFENKDYRNEVFSELSSVIKGEKNTINIKDVKFVNETHKQRFIDAVSNCFGEKVLILE